MDGYDRPPLAPNRNHQPNSVDNRPHSSVPGVMNRRETEVKHLAVGKALALGVGIGIGCAFASIKLELGRPIQIGAMLAAMTMAVALAASLWKNAKIHGSTKLPPEEPRYSDGPDQPPENSTSFMSQVWGVVLALGVSAAAMIAAAAILLVYILYFTDGPIMKGK